MAGRTQFVRALAHQGHPDIDRKNITFTQVHPNGKQWDELGKEYHNNLRRQRPASLPMMGRTHSGARIGGMEPIKVGMRGEAGQSVVMKLGQDRAHTKEITDNGERAGL